MYRKECIRAVGCGLLVYGLTQIPAVLRFMSGIELAECIIQYLLYLPLHMCACWVYQRTNTIWAPIAFQGIVNLSGIVYYFVLSVAGMWTVSIR